MLACYWFTLSSQMTYSTFFTSKLIVLACHSSYLNIIFLGVLIQTIEAGMTDTNMAKTVTIGPRSRLKAMSAFKFTIVSVSELVYSAVNTIGWTDCTEGHIKHYIVGLATRLKSKILDAVVVKDMNDVGL